MLGLRILVFSNFHILVLQEAGISTQVRSLKGLRCRKGSRHNGTRISAHLTQHPSFLPGLFHVVLLIVVLTLVFLAETYPLTLQQFCKVSTSWFMKQTAAMLAESTWPSSMPGASGFAPNVPTSDPLQTLSSTEKPLLSHQLSFQARHRGRYSPT